MPSTPRVYSVKTAVTETITASGVTTNTIVRKYDSFGRILSKTDGVSGAQLSEMYMYEDDDIDTNKMSKLDISEYPYIRQEPVRIIFNTYDEACQIIDEYIHFYSNERIQLKTKLTPQEM